MTSPKYRVNVTMPVFNRPNFTLKSILALRNTAQTIPFCLTVVDNGSEPALVQRLMDLKNGGIIDHLYLLERNMGVACAANIGWEMVDAPYYMKLDNDTMMVEKRWLPKLFALWSHLEPASNLGAAPSMGALLNFGEPIHTPEGPVSICRANLPGQAVLIPRLVSDALGFWNEDYGLYGAEDGDYGLRMNSAGLPQYAYCGSNYFVDLDKTTPEDKRETSDVDKVGEHKVLFTTQGGQTGLFVINNALYNFCIRSWKPMRRYRIVDISADHRVRLEECPQYLIFRKALNMCVSMIHQREYRYHHDLDKVYDGEFIEELKVIMDDVGQSCAAMAEEARQRPVRTEGCPLPTPPGVDPLDAVLTLPEPAQERSESLPSQAIPPGRRPLPDSGRRRRSGDNNR